MSNQKNNIRKRYKEIKSRNNNFVANLIEKCNTNTRFRIIMRQANMPGREYRSFQYFLYMKINVIGEARLPYALVASSIAYSKQKVNGKCSFTKALALSFKDKNQNPMAEMRLRRILSCSSITELCNILHPILRFIHSRNAAILNYEGLLNDLTLFLYRPEIVKARWAQQFYLSEDPAIQRDELLSVDSLFDGET